MASLGSRTIVKTRARLRRPPRSPADERGNFLPLPDPDVIAAEIIEDLQAALKELQAISEDLAQTPAAKEGDTYAGKNTFIQQNN